MSFSCTACGAIMPMGRELRVSARGLLHEGTGGGPACGPVIDDAVERERLVRWAAELVRAVCGAELARDVDRDVAEPVRRIALQMRDAAYAIPERRSSTLAPLADLLLPLDPKEG